MARGDDNSAEHRAVSDARLSELLRAAPPRAFTALRELRARHQAPLLAYARLCTTGESAARQLAAQAFPLAARRTAHGTDHGEPWRHHLLLTATQAAFRWAADERAAGLEPGLLPVLDAAGPDGPVPPLLTAYRSLPSRARGLLWYGVLDREPADRAATLLGLTPGDIAYDTGAALQALGRARLRSRLTASDDPSCPDFQRLIEESVRPDSPRHSADLTAHMAGCAHCAAAHDELSALFDAPRTALAEGLLPWAGTAYALREPEPREPPQGPGTATAAPPQAPAGPRHSAPRPSSGASAGSAADAPLTASAVSAAGAPLSIDRTWPPSRRLALASAALGVALAPLLVLLLPPDTPSAERAAHPVTRTPAPPPTPTTASLPPGVRVRVRVQAGVRVRRGAPARPRGRRPPAHRNGHPDVRAAPGVPAAGLLVRPGRERLHGPLSGHPRADREGRGRRHGRL